MKRSLSDRGCERGHAGCATDVTECATGVGSSTVQHILAAGS